MSQFMTFGLLFLSLFCSTDSQPSAEVNAIAKVEAPTTKEAIYITDELYNLQIAIKTTDINTYSLVIGIALKNGSYFISPHAKRDFKGKFYMDLGSYTQLAFKGDMVETPRSVEVYDSHPFVDGTVNWVRVNTTYEQALLMKRQEDFEVFGRIRFTIEPRCTLEEIPFALSYQDGVMKISSPKC